MHKFGRAILKEPSYGALILEMALPRCATGLQMARFRLHAGLRRLKQRPNLMFYQPAQTEPDALLAYAHRPEVRATQKWRVTGSQRWLRRTNVLLAYAHRSEVRTTPAQGHKLAYNDLRWPGKQANPPGITPPEGQNPHMSDPPNKWFTGLRNGCYRSSEMPTSGHDLSIPAYTPILP